jgi:hypothetical protein
MECWNDGLRGMKIKDRVFAVWMPTIPVFQHSTSPAIFRHEQGCSFMDAIIS